MPRLLAACLTLALLAAPAPAQHDVTAKAGVVVCVSPAAAAVGVDVLKGGGTAVDAAVAVGFALAVAWPEAGNVGGGGFMLVHPGQAGQPTMFDYREAAPLAATATMFAGRIDFTSPRTSGVPGSVRGMALAHAKFGKRPWKELVAPAIKLAADGVPVTAGLAHSLNGVLASKSVTNTEFRRVFGRPGGGAWQAGDVLKQPDLARTLTLIAAEPDAFYTGELADKLDQEMTAGAGLITKQDLAAYRAKERPPVVGTYRGYDVIAAAPPSSGGVTLITMLNILERFDLRKHPRHSPETIHLMTEAMRRAYRDRAAYLGDPDFVKIPAHLTTKDHAAKLAATIDPAKATPSASIAGDIPLAAGPAESPETTHYSVIDATGMAVSTTTTLENSYGCRVVVRGAGYILNNEMTDFNPRPGVTDRAGRIGTPANQVAGGKRMLSSMCPTILAKDGVPVLVTGSPGGRTIINTVLCVVVNVVDYKMNARDAVDAGRHHHAWFPDRVQLEDRPFTPGLRTRLEGMGHATTTARQGDAHTITIDPATGTRTGAADRRLDGAAVGY